MTSVNNNASTVGAVSADTILEPGQLLKPLVSQKTVIGLVDQLYGMTVETIAEQNSYDDRNYRITVRKEWRNSHVPVLCPHGYVFKVLNAMDSQKQHVEAEHGMERILKEKGFNCPVPVLNVHGNDKSLEKLYLENDDGTAVQQDNSDNTRPFKIHLVRLLEFIPGKIFHSVTYTPDLLYDVGKYTAQVQTAFQGYDHAAFNNHKTIWNLGHLGDVQEFVYAVRDAKRRALANTIIETFKAQVLPKQEHFQKGLIHGDINEQNIIVQEKPGQADIPQASRQHLVHGIIDFSDALNSTYLFEVAVMIAHFSVHSTVIEPLLVPGHLLAGYLSERPLNDDEFDALKVCMAGRYATSLVMGEYTFSQDPSNPYVLTTAKQGWQQLENLWQTPKEEVYEKWREIIRSHADSRK